MPKNDFKINLKWIKSHENESLEELTKGFQWTMAFAGATLPSENFKKAFILKENDVIEVNFNLLGFDEKALISWEKLIKYVKNTPIYKQNQSIDLGRFLVFSVYSSWHYYQITGVPPSFHFSSNNTNYQTFAITNSCVADGHRLIKYYIKKYIENSKFIAIEGEGKLTDSTFKAAKFEIIDLMKNGQLRYAIYDLDGKLSDASPTKYGEAGKPAKCLWCHEGVISPLFTENQPVMGYQTPQNFNEEMLQTQQIINVYRKKQNSAVDFTIHKDHELSEILYISFMEPSAERLAKEWNISVEKVKDKLMNFQTHRNNEFDFLGDLYNRNEVEKFAPFQSIPFPTSIREPNKNEPNIFR